LFDSGHDLAGVLWDHRGDPGKQRREERAQPVIERKHHPYANGYNGAGYDGLFCDFTAALPMHKSTLHRRLHLLPDSKPLGVHVFLRLWTS
jgi:hypothetical protein